jgi:hypothetical protein
VRKVGTPSRVQARNSAPASIAFRTATSDATTSFTTNAPRSEGAQSEAHQGTLDATSENTFFGAEDRVISPSPETIARTAAA